jgi:hypothetical protein
MSKSMILFGIFAMVGCGGSSEESKGGTTTALKEKEPEQESQPDPNAVSPEAMEEIDHFFKGKANKLQFNCYNTVVEKTKKKYEGNIVFNMMVEPKGKAGKISITSSTIKSPEIEQCVVSEMQSWEWPSVPVPVPYNGAVSFKPAW